MNRLKEYLDKESLKKTIPVVVFSTVLLMQTQAFCDTSAAEAEMNKMANFLVDFIFAGWVRKSCLALGGGYGLYQIYAANSIKPLLTWGGIGLLVNFIPELINYLTAMGK